MFILFIFLSITTKQPRTHPAANTQQQGQQQAANTQSHQAATNTYSSTTPTQHPTNTPLFAF
nr:hypothetical protein [uncultured Prevotella sp.]